MLKVCVVGCGMMFKAHQSDWHANPDAEIVSVVDIDEAKAKAAQEASGAPKRYADYCQAIEDDVDVVDVVLPHHLHAEVCVAASRAGKHVLCEKPMAMDVGECRQMLSAVEEAGVKFQIGFMRRFDRSFAAAREAVDRGDIGEVVCVKSLTHGPSIPRPWQYDIAKSNGTLAEVNSHDIDTLRWLTGSEYEEVYAVAGNYRCPEARAEFPDYYDNLLLVARMANGAQGLIDGAAAVRYGYDARVEVLGTRGILFVGDPHADSLRVCTPERGTTRTAVPSWRDLFAEAYLAEDADFAACIRDDRAPRVGGMDGLMALRAVEAGNRSIRQRRPVRLEEVDG